MNRRSLFWAVAGVGLAFGASLKADEPTIERHVRKFIGPDMHGIYGTWDECVVKVSGRKGTVRLRCHMDHGWIQTSEYKDTCWAGWEKEAMDLYRAGPPRLSNGEVA